jgi:membrane-associated phospholipid phosphatase
MLAAPRGALLIIVVSFCGILLYALTNYFPSSTPSLMPLCPFEERIPQIPASVWIYLSYFVLLILTGVRIGRLPWAARATATVAFVVICCGISYVVHPTTIIRPPASAEGLSVGLLEWMRTMDPPNNCFPSMHVALAFGCALIGWKARPRQGPWLAVWAVLIAVSTLTTKQHYVLDVAGGLVLAGLAWALFLRAPSVPSLFGRVERGGSARST